MPGGAGVLAVGLSLAGVDVAGGSPGRLITMLGVEAPAGGVCSFSGDALGGWSGMLKVAEVEDVLAVALGHCSWESAGSGPCEGARGEFAAELGTEPFGLRPRLLGPPLLPAVGRDAGLAAIKGLSVLVNGTLKDDIFDGEETR